MECHKEDSVLCATCAKEIGEEKKQEGRQECIDTIREWVDAGDYERQAASAAIALGLADRLEEVFRYRKEG